MLLAVLNHTNGLELSFLRGLDLSGTPQGAGGVGGLLVVTHHGSLVTAHCAACDGNANVMALVTTSGAVVAGTNWTVTGLPVGGGASFFAGGR